MKIFQIQQRIHQLRGHSMIREAYQEWMNRSPTVRELRYWHRNISRKHQIHLLHQLIRSSSVRTFVTQEQPASSVLPPTRTIQMVYHLFRRSADEFVIGLYEEFLNRTPQPQELQGYRNLLRSHNDYWTVFEMIACSPEAQAIWEQNDQVWTVSDLLQLAFAEDGDAFVRRLTRELLARNPLRVEMKRLRRNAGSPEEKEKALVALLYSNAFWRAVRQRRLPGGRVANGFAIGRLRRLCRQRGLHFVKGLYRELLGREPDSEGAALHLKMLRTTGKLELIRGILLSPEAVAHRRGNLTVDTPAPINYPLAVSVIIPTMNQVHMVQQCVQSLQNATRDLEYEIIIVDDGSNRDIQERLKEWGEQAGIHVVAKPENEGFSKTVNVGIRLAQGEHILLLNNDVIFHEPGCLEKLVHVMNQAPDIGIVGARLLFPDGHIQHGGIAAWSEGWLPHRFGGLPGDYVPAQVTDDVLAVTGAVMLLRHQMLDEIGLLSEDYELAFEDIDICFRARHHGWRVIYCGEAVATHLQGATRKNQEDTQFQMFEQREANSYRVFQPRWQGIDISPFRNRKVIYVLTSTGVAGGMKNVFEHVNRLHDLGYNVQLYALENRPSWYPVRVPFQRFGHYEEMLAYLKLEDAIKVATWWETLPIVRASCDPSQGGRGAAFYLVQDLEDSYYPGDQEAQRRVEETYRYPDVHLLTISDWNKHELQRRYNRSAAKISIAIDSNVYQPRHSNDYSSRIVLAISRGSQHLKGFDVTVQALQTVVQRVPDVRVLTFGVEHPQIPGVRVEHIQLPDDSNVAELYSNCNVFVQTSNHEGFGLPILEAMASGAPVVTTRADGNEEFCYDGYNCVLVNRGDVEGVANGIIKVLTTPDFAKRIVNNGQRTALAYSWGHVLFNLNNEFARYSRHPAIR